jgi:L-threonylcarbamoyladenylate synthase
MRRGRDSEHEGHEASGVVVTGIRALAPTQGHIAEAGRLLRDGKLVAFPTETVYGLGASALDEQAVNRIFAAKGRPADNPLIVHVSAPDEISRLASSVSPLAERLVHEHWPGPLTIVLDARADVPRVTTGGLDTIAVRMPAHVVALELLREAGVPIAAPSANRSGRPSPTTAADVIDELGSAVDVVLDGGSCPVGIESTVVDARGTFPVVLREGSVTREELGDVMPAVDRHLLASSPGTRYRHYAPSCAIRIAPPGEAGRLAAELALGGRRVGLISTTPAPAGVIEISRVAGTAELAAQLYTALRQAERAGVDVVVVESVTEEGLGRAVMDRLRRAAGPAGAGARRIEGEKDAAELPVRHGSVGT